MMKKFIQRVYMKYIDFNTYLSLIKCASITNVGHTFEGSLLVCYNHKMFEVPEIL
jgi:hypothetical protein